MTVPIVDLRAQYLRIQAAVDGAIARVVASTQFIGGDECRLFEQEFAAYCGVDTAVGVANGTDALDLALRAFDVGPGDEVVTVANTFIATGEAILLERRQARCSSTWIAGSYTMDPASARGAPSRPARSVHPAGAPLRPARRHGRDPGDRRTPRLPVVEDAAQAHGAEIAGRRAGGLGARRLLQLLPGQEPRRLRRCRHGGHRRRGPRRARAAGRQPRRGKARYDNVVPGTNSRLDALQAAVLRVKLPHLDDWTAERRERAAAYARLLEGVPGVVLPREQAGARSAWHLYTLRVANRDGLRTHLTARGIATAVHYPRPIHLQPAMAAAGGRPGDLPVSERLSQEVIQVPLYPELPMESLERIAQEIRFFYGAP